MRRDTRPRNERSACASPLRRNPEGSNFVSSSGPGLPSAPTPGTEIERIRGMVAVYFPVYETRITPQSLILVVHAETSTLEERFDRLRQEMWAKYYVAQIRTEADRYVLEIVRRPVRSTWSNLTNLVLLFLTVAT